MADQDIEVIAMEIEVVYVDLDGGAGPQGAPGVDGWTPVLANVGDGDRVVMQITDYVGGEGPIPPYIGQYISVSGPTEDIAEALDIRGLQGLQGEKGDKGEDGQILIGGGANIFTEPRDPLPDNSEGDDGDIWINTVTQDLFAKQVGVWVLQTNIKGQPGAQGAQGNPGTPGAPGAAGTNGYSPIFAVVLDGVREVIQITDWSGGTGAKPPAPRYITGGAPSTNIADAINIRGNTGLPGTAGVNGLSVYSGVTDPPVNLGVAGEVFINVATTEMWRKEGSPAAWVMKVVLKGADSTVPGPQGIPGPKGDKGDEGDPSTVPGPQGPAGAAFLTGTTNPSNAIGVNGDSYANVLTGDVFKKAAGAWGTAIGSLKGQTGAQGNQGPTGARGSLWFYAPGAPGTIPGAQALDKYVNTTNGDVYDFTGSDWVSANLNIKGVQGDAGAPGTPGTPGSTGPQGASLLTGTGNPSNAIGVQGDTYINLTTGDVFGPKGASAWPASTGNIKGAPGSPGTPGTNGFSVLSGAGAPSGGLGVVNDLYVNLTNQDFYKKTGASTWTFAFNSKGADGAPGSPGTPGTPGSDGTPGSQFLSGSGAPGSGLGVNGDFYLNTANGDLYKKAAGAWGSPIMNIKGADSVGAADREWFFPGKRTVLNEILVRWVVKRAFSIIPNAGGGIVVTAGQGSAVSFRLNSTTLGNGIVTWSFATTQAQPTVTPNNATPINIAVGDVLTLQCNGIDSSNIFSDVNLVLYGQR